VLRKSPQVKRAKWGSASGWSIAPITTCSHSVALSADRWPDHVRLSELEVLFVCQVGTRSRAMKKPVQSGGTRRTGILLEVRAPEDVARST